MKSLLIMSSLFLSFHTFAQEVYTFDCASDQGYLVVRVEAEKFNSQLKQVPGEFEIHSDNGSEVFTSASFSNRLINSSSGVFRFLIGMGRGGSANMRGNFLDQSGSFSVKTAKNSFSSNEAVCRFDNGLATEE